MSTSAGVATAADEGTAAAVRGDISGAQAAILIVSHDPGTREILHRELSKRYGADYQIMACHLPADLAAWMRDLRAARLPVALVIGGVGAQDPDGIEVLAAVRAIDAAQVIGERWSARSQELRDLFARHRVPAGFYDATCGHGRQMLRDLGL